MISLRLANWIVALAVEPAALAKQVADRFAAFATEAAPAPDLRISVRCEADDDTAHSILQERLQSNGEDYLLDGPHFYGMIGPFRGQATLSMRSAAPAREVEYFLRVALALFAFSRGGLLIHSAAIKLGDTAHLFTGQSGSGKSTVVAISQSVGKGCALSDDLVVLRPVSGGWQVHGTPFWNAEAGGRDGQTGSALAKAIYRLVQDRDVFVESMSTAAATAELVANCPIVNSQPDLLPPLLERCRDVVKAVGMKRLHFRKDDAFWEIISC